MKIALRLSLLSLVLLLFAPSGSAFVSPAVVPISKDEVKPKPSPFAGMTVKDFLSLTPRKYRELTGQRLKLSQKISLKLAQMKVKKLAKKNKQIELMQFTAGIDTTDFNVGGFILGIILGPIGVLIAYVIGEHTLIKWAWIGAAIWLAIFLLILII